MSAREARVPVGLFGFAANRTRVAGVMAASKAGMSWPYSRAGAVTTVAPNILATIG